jgi:hypothetical protein
LVRKKRKREERKRLGLLRIGEKNVLEIEKKGGESGRVRER